jgi:hypothetical protein
MTEAQKSELEFRRGYYLAVANIIRTHCEYTVAEDVLRGYGTIDFKGIDPLEIKLLKRVASEIKRKSSLRKSSLR